MCPLILISILWIRNVRFCGAVEKTAAWESGVSPVLPLSKLGDIEQIT